MKGQPLWEISISTTLEAEDAVMELCGRVFDRSAASYTNEQTKITIVSVHCRNQSEWTTARRAALLKGLRAIKASGLNCGATKIISRPLAREDWAESWKRHFKPIEIGSRLLIKPGWVKRAPRKNQAVVVLDPGLSFGTGNHPTTAFCLRQLAMGRRAGILQSFWDVGTGSGILAIAASKLGFAPVRAIDFDPVAVRTARANAKKNGVLKQLKLSRQDITSIPATTRRRYDFICANLISDLLVSQMERIVSRLHPGGRLVIAGILKEEFAHVQKVCEKAGLKLVASRTQKEWRSGAFIYGRHVRSLNAGKTSPG